MSANAWHEWAFDYEATGCGFDELAPDDVNQTNSSGMTPLHCACMNNGKYAHEIVEKLLTIARDSICVQDKDGDTPLHLAVQNDRRCIEMVGAIMKHPEALKALAMPNKEGLTPLHLMLGSGDPMLFTEDGKPRDLHKLFSREE